MILVDQRFKECSFCGRKLPPQWPPIVKDSKLYCSEKCIAAETIFAADLAPQSANSAKQAG